MSLHPSVKRQSPRIYLSRSGLALGIVLLALASGGCIFSPNHTDRTGGGGGGTPVPPAPPRKTAHGAIQYLIYAWTYRDSLCADTVYTADYQGTSVDANDPTGSQTLSFAKSDEVRALGGVALSQEVSKVYMDFHLESTWTDQKYAGDPPDWVAIQINKPSITIDLVGGSSLVANDSDFFEFKVKPQVVAPGDTLWQIVRWTEHRPIVPGT